MFSALLRSCVCSKVQKVLFHSQCILVQAHRKVVGGNSGIPVTAFIVFCFYLILTGPSAMLRVDSALSPAMFLILLLITSFCPLSFCTWCCFFHAGREGFLKSNLQILLYRAPCIQIDCQQFCKAFLGGGGGGINPETEQRVYINNDHL